MAAHPMHDIGRIIVAKHIGRAVNRGMWLLLLGRYLVEAIA
jgi:hypothetical protein